MSDSTLLNQPKSTALLQPSKFQLQFVRIPDVVYFCHKVTLPGGSVKPVTQDTPFKSRLRAGHKLEYETFPVTFIVEETMYSWQGIHDWLKDIGTETGFQDYNDLKNFPKQPFLTNADSYPNAYSDATLTILDVNNIPRIRFNFLDSFPIKLGNIEMDTESSALNVIHCSAQFGFFYIDIERL